MRVPVLDFLVLVPVRMAIRRRQPGMRMNMVAVVVSMAVNVCERFVDVHVVMAIEQQENHRRDEEHATEQPRRVWRLA